MEISKEEKEPAMRIQKPRGRNGLAGVGMG